MNAPVEYGGQVYHPLHIHLTPAHCKKLLSGKVHRVHPDRDLHPDGAYGGRLTHLGPDNAKRARRALKNGKAFHLRFTPDEMHVNTDAACGGDGATLWTS